MLNKKKAIKNRLFQNSNGVNFFLDAEDAVSLEVSAEFNGQSLQPEKVPPSELDLQGLDLIVTSETHPKKLWRIKAKRKSNLGCDLNTEWTLNDKTTFFLSENQKKTGAHITYIHPEYGDAIPLPSSHESCISIFLARHRIEVEIALEILDSNLRTQSLVKKSVPHGKVGGTEIEGYFNPLFKLPAASDRNVYFRISLNTKKEKTKDAMDGYTFFTKPSLEIIHTPESTRLEHRAVSEILLQDYEALQEGKLQAFAVSLPLSNHGNKGVLTAQYPDGRHLLMSPMEFQPMPDSLTARIKSVENRSCFVSINNPENRIFQGSLSLQLDGHYVADFAINEKIEEIRVEVPQEVLDGRSHLFELIHPNGEVLYKNYYITHNWLTPWHALQEHCMPPLKGALAPVSSYRYESLKLNLAQNVYSGELLHYCHEVLLGGAANLSKPQILEFKQSTDPKISVVIPIHNKFEVTYLCLCSLIFAYEKIPFEVIIVDDGSQDQSIAVPDLVKGITYIRNEQSQGFVNACNRGAKAANGKYIYFLNNDTEVTANWATELIHAFEGFDDVGLVGSKLIYPDGTLQESGGIVWSSGDPWNYGRGQNAADPKFGYTRQVDYVSGAALSIRSDIWKEVGGFSQEFAPAYFEDTDLAFKVRDKGYKTLVAPLSVVIHYEGVSNGTEVSSGMKRYQEKNRPVFRDKWEGHFRDIDLEQEQLDVVKDANIKKRALFIDHQFPKPDMDAGSFAAIQEMRCMQALGYKVTYFPENLSYLGKYCDGLNRMGVECIYRPFAFSLEEVLRKIGKDLEIVYITRYYVAKNHIPLVRLYAPNAKILFCNADLHFLREKRAALLTNDQESLLLAEKVMEEEIEVMRTVDVTLSYNKIEHEIIREVAGKDVKVTKAPWIVEAKENPPPYETRSDIAFLGGFGHPPNVEAVNYFVRKVWPLVEKELPGVKFKIYGSKIPEDIKVLQSDSVIAEGFIADTTDIYNTNRIFVAPLLSGAGIKGKVLSALAHGIPNILSPIASEGIPLEHGKNCFIANTTDDWLDALVKLYKDSDIWQRVSQESTKLAKEHYSEAKAVITMCHALETAGASFAERNMTNKSSLAYKNLLP